MGRLDKQKNALNAWAKMSGIAFQMFGIIALGTFGGHKIDSKCDREIPVFTIILSLLSVAIAIYVVIRQVNQLNKDEDEKQD